MGTLIDITLTNWMARVLAESEAEFGTGHWPVAAGCQPAAIFGGKLPPKTGW